MKKITLLFCLTAAVFALISISHPAAGSFFKLTNQAWAQDEVVDEAEEDNPMEFSINGFIESENFMSTYSDQDFSHANKKNEVRTKLEIKYGTESNYLFLVPNIYIQPGVISDTFGEDYHYSDETEFSRNLALSSENWEISFKELYFNFDREKFRIRAGNQLYAWGTADGINPTAYFNPYDEREFIFRDDDELKSTSPSVSAMVFSDEYTWEFVFAPFPLPMPIATNGNFWALKSGADLYSFKFEKNDGMDISPENFAIGMRVSRNIGGADTSLSVYRGPDREAVFVPVSIKPVTDSPVVVDIKPEYYVVHMVGADFSMTEGDFVFQCEAAYSPDKRNIAKQNVSLDKISLPYEVKRSHYLAYAAGFNYFIPLSDWLEGHDGESVFTFEWYQAQYFDKDLDDPLLSDLLSSKYQDSFFDGRLKVSLQFTYDNRNGGSVFWPKLGYDFQNGLTTELGYGAITGKAGKSGLINNMFYYFTDNDIIMWRIRYEF